MDEKLEGKKSKKIYFIIALVIIVLVILGFFVYDKFIKFKPKPIPFRKYEVAPVNKIKNGEFLQGNYEVEKGKVFGLFNDDLVPHYLASDDCPELNGRIVPPLGFASIVAPNRDECTVYLKEKPENKVKYKFR
jgi:hypothetical protein